MRGEVRYKNEITGPRLQLRNSIDSLGVSRFWRTNDSAGGRKKKEESERKRENERGGERERAREAAKNKERKGRMEEKGISFLCLTRGWDRDKKLNEPAFFKAPILPRARLEAL